MCFSVDNNVSYYQKSSKNPKYFAWKHRANFERRKIYQYFILEQKLQAVKTYSSRFYNFLNIVVNNSYKIPNLQIKIRDFRKKRTYGMVLKEFGIPKKMTCGLIPWVHPSLLSYRINTSSRYFSIEPKCILFQFTWQFKQQN